MEQERGRRDGDRPAQGTDRYLLRQQRAQQEGAHRAKTDAPVDAERDGAADRDAFAALEIVQHREAVAQHAGARAETQADLTAQSLARQHAGGGLRRVPREGQQARAPAVHARHIGRARVAASLLADIAAEERLGGKDRKTHRADHIGAGSDGKTFQNQGKSLLRLHAIMFCSL